MTTEQAVSSLRSEICPHCKRTKSSYKSLCRKCFMALPGPQQMALYRRVGNGYEAAIEDALALLTARDANRKAALR